MSASAPRFPRGQSGSSLVEVLMALVMLSVGILSIARLFPQGSKTQLKDRQTTAAGYYAQEKLERLIPLGWNDTQITDGRHPASGTESLGGGTFNRWYEVSTMSPPLDNLKLVTVSVSWTYLGLDTVVAVTYKRR